MGVEEVREFIITSHATKRFAARHDPPLPFAEAEADIETALILAAWARPKRDLPPEKTDLYGLRLEIQKGVGMFALLFGPWAFPVRVDPGRGLIVLTAYTTRPEWWEPWPGPPLAGPE